LVVTVALAGSVNDATLVTFWVFYDAAAASSSSVTLVVAV